MVQKVATCSGCGGAVDGDDDGAVSVHSTTFGRRVYERELAALEVTEVEPIVCRARLDHHDIVHHDVIENGVRHEHVVPAQDVDLGKRCVADHPGDLAEHVVDVGRGVVVDLDTVLECVALDERDDLVTGRNRCDRLCRDGLHYRTAVSAE